MQSPFQVLPRTVQRETPLVDAAVLYPGSDPAYRALAESLARAMEQVCGARPELLADNEVMPSRSTPLPDRCRQRPLILIGNLNTNRAVLPLYARYLCATDATYPGGSGYDLRTLVNPYGTGTNVILAGGSSFMGVRRAVERLIERVAACDGRLPFLLEVDLEPGLARALAEWPDAPLSVALDSSGDPIRKTHQFNEDTMKLIAAYGIMYAWTGNRHYGDLARDLLMGLNAQMGDSYGDWHYRAERMLRVIPHLIAGGFLDAAAVLRTDQLLLGTTLGTENMWWRLRSGNPPFGHRHHGRGTFEFLLSAHYLREQANPNEALRARCDQWIAESRAYLDALGRAGIDDQDDESTLTNLATVFWYALAEERFDFFESGSARRIALRAIALHDNMGAGAGQGGYGEGFPGMLYLQQEATVPIAASAFYYQDASLKWILERIPHLKAPLISGFLHFSPLVMHMFDSGDQLAAITPENLTGLHVLPITSHQYAISTDPPEHIETAGHSVNAPETWRRGEGIGLNTLAPEQGFDKLVLRGGFAPTDSYLLLQGYQGGFRWQGHMQAANCIVRFSQAGHIFLVQSTNRHSSYQKNGLFISDGCNSAPIPPIAERLAAADFEQVGLSVTRLSDFHHGDWTRHIFWSKRGEGVFVVIDSVAFQQDGTYSLTCTWRTPGFARLQDRIWQTQQGGDVFTLRWSEPLSVTSEAETDQGGTVPYVLRQRVGADFKAGEVISFQNLFYVRPHDRAEDFALYKLAARQALVTRSGQPFAWCAIANADGEIRGLGLTLRALSVWVSADEIGVSGLTRLSFDEWGIEPDQPIDFSLDFASGRASAAGLAALSQQAIVRLGDMLRANLARLQPPAESDPITRQPQPSNWTPDWSFDEWTPLPKRIRDLTVEAVPAPLDGFADQLIDTVVAEIRQTRQQWPAAEQYQITLTLAEETPLDHLRVIGDSTIDPTLRTFHPLPAGISVAVSSDGFQNDERICPLDPQPDSLRYKLFRDIEDQLEARSARIDATARQIRVCVPAPADGAPLVLHEIEVYGSETVVPPVERLIAADLRGDGEQDGLLVNAANELVVISQSGTELWRKRFPAPVTHLSTHDLRGRGSRSVCVGLLGGELQIYTADGTLETAVPLADRFQQQRDAYFGRVYTIHDVQVWQRDDSGRAALVVGGYSAICFLDTDYQIVGHSWADGSWQNNILVAPETGDLWVRSGWNHGIGVYAGKAGFAPSGETIPFGGVNQPMFRGIRAVIPFVNGRTAAYEWLGANILAAAENGVGVLSTKTRDWLWKIEGGTPITACIAANAEVIVGGADGFVSAFAQADGSLLHKRLLDAPVTGLAALPGLLAVATRRGLLLLDDQWEIQCTYPHPIARLLRMGDRALAVAREDGRLERLSL